MKRPNQSPRRSGSFIRSSVQRLDHALHRGGVDLVGIGRPAPGPDRDSAGPRRRRRRACRRNRRAVPPPPARACRSRTSGRHPRRRRGAARRAAGRACRRGRAPSRGSGVKSRSSLSSTSSRKSQRRAFGADASTCQRRWPCACSRNTSYWSTCAPTEPPGAAKRHHHVVDAPARQEVERRQQRGDVGVPLVDVLHQQGPVVVAAGVGNIAFGERAVAQQPAVVLAVVRDDARQRGLLAGQAGQVFRRDRRDEARETHCGSAAAASASSRAGTPPAACPSGGMLPATVAASTSIGQCARWPSIRSPRARRSARPV